MKPTKIIICNDLKISNKLINQLSLEKKATQESLVYAGSHEDDGETYEIILIQNLENDIVKLQSIITEVINIHKILVVSSAEVLDNEDIKNGDVIVPNTFMEKGGEDSIFLDYAIGENFDLQKFSLHLSGICISGESIDESKEEYLGDVYEKNMYNVLRQIKTTDSINKTVVICGVNGDDMIENLSAIVGFVL